jgi:hypothetical protein
MLRTLDRPGGLSYMEHSFHLAHGNHRKNPAENQEAGEEQSEAAQ